MAIDWILGVTAGLALGAGVAVVCYFRGWDRGNEASYWDGVEMLARERSKQRLRALPALPNETTVPTAPYRVRDNSSWLN